MAPPKTRQVLGARQRAKDQALVVLQEEYDIRPRIASIPLAERDILGERIGKTYVALMPLQLQANYRAPGGNKSLTGLFHV